MREVARITVGGHEVFGTRFHRAGLDRVLTARPRTSARRFRDAVVCRRMRPGVSQRAHAEFMADIRPEAAAVEKWYRMMDALTEPRIAALQAQITATNGVLLPAAATEVLFFDATTLHFESPPADALRRKGGSQNGKSNRVPVVLAVRMGPGGLPMGDHRYPGNTTDVRTLQPALADVRRRHGAVPMAWVRDAGMLSADNRTALAAANCDDIIAAHLRKLPRAVRDRVCDVDADGPPDETGRRMLDLPVGDRRLVVRYDPRRARKDAADRACNEQRARTILRSGTVSRHRYIAMPRGGSAPRIHEGAIARDARWNGWHRVWTSLTTLPAAAVRQRDAELWTIEQGFRTLKTDLGIRPVFHGTERWVLTHIAIGCAAFARLRMLMLQLRRTKAWAEPLSEGRVLDPLRAVQASVVRNDDTDRRYLLPSAPQPLPKAIDQRLDLRLPEYCHPLESAMSS